MKVLHADVLTTTRRLKWGMLYYTIRRPIVDTTARITTMGLLGVMFVYAHTNITKDIDIYKVKMNYLNNI